MENLIKIEGLKNHALNIKPIMLKIKNNEKLSQSELKSVLEFYLETVQTISNIE